MEPRFELHEGMLAFRRRRRIMAASRPESEGLISNRELTVLLIIEDQEDRTIKDLSEQLHIEQSWMSRLVAGLHKRGLLRTFIPERDKRSRMLRITPTGKKALSEALSFDASIMSESLKEISKEDQKKLLRFLTLFADGYNVPPFPAHPEGHPIYMALMRLTRAFQLHSDDYLGTSCNVTQLQILGIVEKHGENGVQISDLDPIFPLDVSTLSRIIASLETKGLLKKERSEIDKRAFALKLTSEGGKTLTRYHRVVTDKVSDGLADISKSDLAEANRILAAIDGGGEKVMEARLSKSIEVRELGKITDAAAALLSQEDRKRGGDKRYGLFLGDELKGVATLSRSGDGAIQEMKLSVKEVSDKECRNFLHSCLDI